MDISFDKDHHSRILALDDFNGRFQPCQRGAKKAYFIEYHYLFASLSLFETIALLPHFEAHANK